MSPAEAADATNASSGDGWALFVALALGLIVAEVVLNTPPPPFGRSPSPSQVDGEDVMGEPLLQL